MTDEELMLAYAEGDVEAFQALYHRHKQRIFGYLLARLKDRSEAEDVFQTVFAKLHAARHKYRREIPFLPWIFTISRNALIDHARKRGTERKHVIFSTETVEASAAEAPGVAAAGIALEELSGLTPDQRQALELRFSQGLDFREIGEQMQTTADNARQIASRAIRRLRTLMAGKETCREEKS